MLCVVIIIVIVVAMNAFLPRTRKTRVGLRSIQHHGLFL